MNDEHSNQRADAERQRSLRHQESEARYERARRGSFEGEHSARLDHQIQSLQNQLDRLEQRVADLESELTALKRE